MKKIMLITVLFSFTASTFAHAEMRRDCQLQVKMAVRAAAKKLDENSSLNSVRNAGAFAEVTGFENIDTRSLDMYFAEVTDESGSCVWTVLANGHEGCHINKVQQLYCF